MKWSLDNLYKGFEVQEYKNDLNTLNSEIDEVNKFFHSNLLGRNDEEFLLVLEKIILSYESIMRIYDKLSNFVFLTLSCNSNDGEAKKNDSILKEINVKIILISSNIGKLISKRENLINILHKSKTLQEYEFYIKNSIEESKYLLNDELEESMSSLYNYGAVSFSNLHEAMVSKYNVKINLHGEEKEIPLTECRGLLDSSSKEIRRKALESEKQLYEYMKEPIAYGLNSIKKSVIYDCKKRGYKSPLEKSLKNNRITQETLNSLIRVIKENLDFFRDFLKLKGTVLGNDENKVHFSDLFCPTRISKKFIDFDYAKQFLIENFNNFNKDFGKFVERAFNEFWIDSQIYSGKVGGAFCSTIRDVKESRILLNFTNSYDSIFTLAHELGHAYHGEILKNERILNTDYPMTIAETASIFSETLICDKAYSFGDESEKIMILEYELNSACQTIVDIYSRFLFESEVFRRCENEFLTPSDLNSIMKNAQIEAYGDAMYDDYFEEAWIYKSHYYDMYNNFYNFPYAFGQLFSLGLYDMYLNDEDSFHSKYELILKNSGKKTIESLCQMCSIDITKKEFFENSIKILKNKYNNYKKLIL